MMKRTAFVTAMFAVALTSAQAQEAPAVGPNVSMSANSTVENTANNVSDSASEGDAIKHTSISDSVGFGSSEVEAPGVERRAVASRQTGDTTCRVLPRRAAQRKGNC